MASDNDDGVAPVQQKEPVKNLEVMSIAALNLYLEDLKREIGRVGEMIEIKKKARSSADSIFKR